MREAKLFKTYEDYCYPECKKRADRKFIMLVCGCSFIPTLILSLIVLDGRLPSFEFLICGILLAYIPTLVFVWKARKRKIQAYLYKKEVREHLQNQNVGNYSK